MSLTLFHASPSRSSGVMELLEEIGAPYEVHRLDIKAGDTRAPDYLAINPMGKVPAILHDGVLVTEQTAIFTYLADAFPQAGLAPAIGDPDRGPYLRWLALYGSCFEMAVIDRAMQRTTEPPSMNPYGDFATFWGVVTRQLEAGPYLLGERFSAADMLWGSGLTWTTGWKLVPEHPAVADYIAHHGARASVQRARARDAALAAKS